MDLLPTDEQQQIIDAARTFLSKELPVDYQRWEPGPLVAKDRALMATFAELGWFALGLAEDRGGLGLGPVEDMLLFREAGRALVAPVLLAGVIAARIAPIGSVEGILTGLTRVGFAIPHGNGVYLIDAADADLVLLVDGESISLFDRPSFSDAAEIRSVDGSVTLQSASRPAGSAQATGDATTAHTLSLLLAAMLCGNAEAVRDLCVSHASERSQFGQKIGTFQAISHPLAEMAVRCESAFAQTKYASVALADASANAGFHVTAARIIAQRAALSNAQAAVQIHGGMGFAAEYPVHLFLKRAHLIDQIGGRLSAQLDRLIMMEAA